MRLPATTLGCISAEDLTCRETVMHAIRPRLAAQLLLLLTLHPAAIDAQTTFATITGTVTDGSGAVVRGAAAVRDGTDRKSTRLNSSHGYISYAVFCLKKKK